MERNRITKMNIDKWINRKIISLHQWAIRNKYPNCNHYWVYKWNDLYDYSYRFCKYCERMQTLEDNTGKWVDWNAKK